MSRATLRGEISIDSDILGLLGSLSDITGLLDTYPINVSPMFAIDAGFLINFYNVFSLSGVIKDLYTPYLKYSVASISDLNLLLSSSEDVTGNIIDREINFGLSSNIPLGILSVVISDLNVYVDYYDLLNFNRNIFLHMGAGINFELLKKFNILTGFYQGLISLGLDVDLGGFNLGFVMYGTEEGSQPGANSVFNFLFSLGISI